MAIVLRLIDVQQAVPKYGIYEEENKVILALKNLASLLFLLVKNC